MECKRRTLLLSLVPALLLTGCQGGFLPYAHDIERVELVEVLGIDQGEEENTVAVTLSTGLRRTGDSGETKAPLVYHAQGETVYQCALEIQSKGVNYLSCTHTGNCLLGEEAARSGVQDLTDFIERDTEMRLNTNLFVVQEGTAAELVDGSTGEDVSVVDRLQALVEDVKSDPTTYLYTVKDLTVGLEQNGCGLVPSLKLGEEEAEVTGFACFRQNKLVGYFNEEQAMGVNLLENHITGGQLPVTLQDGSVLSLRLKKTRCRWEPVWEGETLVGLTAQVTVHAGLEELRGCADPERDQVRREMTQALEDALTERAVSALAQLQTWDADALHLEEVAALGCPSKQKAIAQAWAAGFSQLQLQVVVTGVVDQTYDIAQPMGEGET